jgi:hypothetical protein
MTLRPETEIVMFRSKMIAICGPLLVFELFCQGLPCPPWTTAAEPDSSANATVRPSAWSDGRVTPEERQKRVRRIGSISDAQLENELAGASSLDADVGIPLLRLQSQCRVALERLKLQIGDLASLPEVRRADATVTRPEFKARLVALRSKAPAEMVSGFLTVLRDSNLTIEDVALLADLRKAQQRLREWKKWDGDLLVKAKEHAEAVKAQQPYLHGNLGAFEKVEEQRDLLKKQLRTEPVEPPGTPADSRKILEVIKAMTETPGSQGAER